MGVPSIVVWHMFDQPYWGNRLFNLGAGPRPLPRLGLTAETLACHISEALTHESYREVCTTLSAQLRGEHGLTDAARKIAEIAERAKR
jgi:sterol 3beta-glucosyltransferase